MADKSTPDEMELDREFREAHEARTPWGPMTPDAAMARVEQVLSHEAWQRELDDANAARRAKQLETPVHLEGCGISIPRTVYEEIWDIFATAQSYDDEVEALAKMVLLLEREGLITVNRDGGGRYG